LCPRDSPPIELKLLPKGLFGAGIGNDERAFVAVIEILWLSQQRRNHPSL
jgi:hypothetical protein